MKDLELRNRLLDQKWIDSDEGRKTFDKYDVKTMKEPNLRLDF